MRISLAVIVSLFLAACASSQTKLVSGPEPATAVAAPVVNIAETSGGNASSPRGAPARPVVVIGESQITLDATLVGSTHAIDSVERLLKLDELAVRLAEARSKWESAHQGEAFPATASLVVPPTASRWVFASTYLTMVYAGYVNIHVAYEDRYLATKAAIDPPCASGARECEHADAAPGIHVQGNDEQWWVWTLSSDGTVNARGAANEQGFGSALAGVIASEAPSRVTFHVPAKGTFESFGHYLALVAGEFSEVLVSVRDITEIEPRGVHSNPRPESGRLPPEVIQRVVRQNFGAFRKCYEEEALRNDPKAEGRLAVRFVIGRDGTVPNVGITTTGGLPDEVADCIKPVFLGLVFPPPDGGIVTVSYPLVFVPTEKP